ncbi:MAG: hypothetical protein IH991_22230 [Planctomycetes bacterium]|nr:hypothetical protein [Planctomycetota bacterium]
MSEQWKQFLLHVNDLPKEGLSDIRIGFDVRGAGAVWIDNLAIYDLWLDDDQHRGFRADLEVAEELLNEGRVSDCRKFLAASWPQIVRHRIPLDPNFGKTMIAKKEPAETKPPQHTNPNKRMVQNERRLNAIVPDTQPVNRRPPRVASRPDPSTANRNNITPLPPITPRRPVFSLFEKDPNATGFQRR